jgi:hypothetical protein
VGIRPDDIVVVFDHNILGSPDSYVVELDCRDDTSLLTYDCVSQGFIVDAHWYAFTNTSISVWVRGGQRPDYIRVRIYGEAPAYDSGWDDLGIRVDPIVVPFLHNLSGNPNHLLVNLTCEDDVLGIYDCVAHNFLVDANWFDLTNVGVDVWVKSFRPDAIRVRIFLKSSANYESGWHVIGIRPDPLSIPFSHNLGGDPDMYYVDLQCWDDSSLQVYQCGNQGFNINAHWYGLTDSSISVYVTGVLPDSIRVRIWTTHSLFLPIVVNE